MLVIELQILNSITKIIFVKCIKILIKNIKKEIYKYIYKNNKKTD